MPVSESRVRMTRESVDFYVGERKAPEKGAHLVRIVAVFEMANESTDTVSLKVGFPVQTVFAERVEWWQAGGERPPNADSLVAEYSAEEFRRWGVYDFRVSINGGEVINPSYVKAQGEAYGPSPTEYLWYGWEMCFPPGETTVVVSYHVSSNPTGGEKKYWYLRYVMYTGSFWKGSIGHAVLRVHFPVDASTVELGPFTTPGFKLEKTSIVWEFHDFEPSPRDNFLVRYLYPSATTNR